MSRKIPGRDAGKESILIYGMEGTEQGQKLKKTAVRMGIRCRVIEADQIGQPLGALLHIPGYELVAQSFGQSMEMNHETAAVNPMTGKTDADKTADPAQLTEPAMIMQGFTQNRLDEFLKELRRNEVPRIDLKAVVTPYNIGWRFSDLYQELQAERAAVLEARRAWEAQQKEASKAEAESEQS